MFVHEAPIERRWWPRGIVTGTTPDPERGPMCHKVHTRWGTLRGWWPSEGVDAVLDPAWWAGRVDAMEVESVEPLAEDDLGRLVRLIGEDRAVARLLHLQPRSAPDLRLLVEEVVPLIQVIDHGGAPSILIHADHDPVSDSPPSAKSVGDLLGRVQARWFEHGLVTGPTPRWWNDRLKRLEDATRATTLWRAPLTRDAVGLPSIHLHPSCLVRIGGALGLRLDPDPAVLELIDTTHRRPAMAQLAALERLIPETSQHRDLHDAWAVHVPERWSSRRAHDTTRGAIGSSDTKRHSFNPPSDWPSMMTASPPLEGGSTMSIGSRPHSAPIGSGLGLDWPHGSSVLSCSSLRSPLASPRSPWPRSVWRLGSDSGAPTPIGRRAPSPGGHGTGMSHAIEEGGLA